MISCPRVPKFELLVVDFALRLLQQYGDQFLNKRASLEKDLADIKTTNSFEEITIL